MVFVANPREFEELKIPLVGFGSRDMVYDKEVKEIISGILKEEGITPDNFVIKQIPELTLEGSLRDAFIEVKDLKIGKAEEDELNPGKKKIRLTFTLGKGSYATLVVRTLFL